MEWELKCGAFIFASDMHKYLNSDKFLAKMTIVLVLTINGFLFHLRHIPWLGKHENHVLSKLPDFKRRRLELMLSGAASSISWLSALILGTFKSIPYNYTEIMLVYLGFLAISLFGAVILRKRLL